MKRKKKINNYINELKCDLDKLYAQYKSIEKIVNIIESSDRIFICGNGGSACTASHITEDLLSLGYDAYCLSDNIGRLTALSNDYNYQSVFSKQIEDMGKCSDILIVISGSGNSINLIMAIKKAKERSMKTIALLGSDGGQLKKYYGDKLDICINVPSDMQHSEDWHLILGHIIYFLIKN